MPTNGAGVERIVADGDTWTVYEGTAGFRVVDPDWRKVKISRKQVRILNSPARNILVNAGTGFGKDWVGVEWAKRLAKRLYRTRTASGWRRGGPLVTVAICAPTESNYLETWDKLKDQIPKVPGNSPDGSLNYEVRDGKRKYIQLFGRRGIRFEMVTLFRADSVRGRGWDICLITEAAYMEKITFRKVVLKRVNRGGYYGAIMLISTPKNNWFDVAGEDARDKKGGEFSTYEYHHATSYDNPLLDEETRVRIRQQELGNREEFEQERMAKLFVLVTEGGADCPIAPGMITCCLTKEPIKAGNSPVLVFDLMYGGADMLCLGVWNPNTFGLAYIKFWTSEELKIDRENPMGSLVPLIEREAAKWPGCRIAFDAQGQYGGSLQHLLPARLRITAMRRTREKKNDHVEDLITRISTVNEHGRSEGVTLPDPTSPHLEPSQREAITLMLEQIAHYRKVHVLNANGDYRRKPDGSMEYYYTKGEGHGDDGVDMVTWACSQLPPFRRRAGMDHAAIRMRRLG